jgi:hypothetical protein
MLTGPPGEATPYAVYWPTTIPSDLVPARVLIEDQAVSVSSVAPPGQVEVTPTRVSLPPAPSGPAVSMPLGNVVGARSGDKGGNANLGVWGRTAEAYAWLDSFLTIERLKQLIPESAPLEVERFELPNLLAMNFVIHGLLGEGVASSTRIDPQAKTLGEYLRAKMVEVPAALVRTES